MLVHEKNGNEDTYSLARNKGINQKIKKSIEIIEEIASNEDEQ